MNDQIAYALAWAFFALGHSGLAAPTVKRRLAPLLGRGQRLAYNAVAIAQFAVVAWVGATVLGDRPAFALPAWALTAMMATHGTGWAVLIGAARFYDLGRLAGTAQWPARLCPPSALRGRLLDPVGRCHQPAGTRHRLVGQPVSGPRHLAGGTQAAGAIRRGLCRLSPVGAGADSLEGPDDTGMTADYPWGSTSTGKRWSPRSA